MFSTRVLVHPNTGDALKDHTVRANWMGKEVPVNIGIFR
jgi:aromatic ring-cleaving dioxygenase